MRDEGKERLHRARVHDPASRSLPSDALPVPGKRTLTAAVPAAVPVGEPAGRDESRAGALPAHALLSRSVQPGAALFGGAPAATQLMRQAYDNGVRDGADHAVQRASSSSGHALPVELRRKFEASLGVGLGDVRVHTGGDSAEAAASVSARAYAVGQDIHFGAGQYDPSSQAGQHLLAHEVAHTVQQRGAVARAAFKLDVSAPADAHELEADRAADAMVAGVPARVSSGGSVVNRDFPQDLNLQPPPPKPLLPGGLDPNDPLIKKLLDGGGGPGIPLQPELDIGVTPNPLDPFERPATDWDSLAVATPGPDQPGEWYGVTHLPLAPLPRLRFDGKPCSRVTSDQKDAAAAALSAFESVYVDANARWNRMVPGITSFMEASKDLAGTGMLGSEGGLGWNAGDKDADLSKLTGQQKIGPSSDKTIDDLFKNKDGTAGTDVSVSASGAKATKKTKELLNSAKRAANEARTAASEHKIAQSATKGTAEGVRAAVLLVEINAAEVAADKLQEEKDNLQKEKDSATETLDTVVSGLESLTLIGFGLGEVVAGKPAEGAESLLIGAEIGAEIIGKLIINAKYDDKIEAADKQLRTAIAGIRGKKGAYVQAALASATIAHDSAMARVRTTKETMLAKVAAYQSAYDAFAEEAGKAAGGGAKGAQIQAALEAVPRIEHCLGQITQITASIKLPTYTEPSGKGFNGFGKPKEFITYLSQMKGYQSKFKQLETTWKARLVSLKAIEKQFGP